MESTSEYTVKESKTWEVTRTIKHEEKVVGYRVYRLWKTGDGDWKMQEIDYTDENPVKGAIFIPWKVVEIMLRERNKDNLKE
jgi:hypothetical protein